MRRALRLACLVTLVALAATASAEILLRYRAAVLQPPEQELTPVIRLERAYEPFARQHLHPYYLFFFPLDRQERIALANDVCSLDADGFREPGPKHAGPRKLAFLVGGSTAFGYYASSNDQTITSHLNRLQGEYFFVNAGVPSWNSTQELVRVAMEIVDLNPALVVAFDGANDAVLAGQTALDGSREYPAGTPEYFADLDAMIAGREVPDSRVAIRRILPEVMLRLDRLFGTGDVPGVDEAMDATRVAAAAARYRANHARMASLAAGSGARFLAAFQPIAHLHSSWPPGLVDQNPVFETFHRLAAADKDEHFLDLSTTFDSHPDTVPVGASQYEPAAVFVDDVHLTDRGNAIVASRLWTAIQALPTVR